MGTLIKIWMYLTSTALAWRLAGFHATRHLFWESSFRGYQIWKADYASSNHVIMFLVTHGMSVNENPVWEKPRRPGCATGACRASGGCRRWVHRLSAPWHQGCEEGLREGRHRVSDIQDEVPFACSEAPEHCFRLPAAGISANLVQWNILDLHYMYIGCGLSADHEQSKNLQNFATCLLDVDPYFDSRNISPIKWMKAVFRTT